MYSDNLWEVAERLGWWDRHAGQPLDFLKTYAPTRYHPNYVYNRVWRVLSLAAPSLNLPAVTNVWGDDYPFSVKVEGTLLSARDVMNMQRDHFQGTVFDTGVGLAGGPYGDPNRFDLGAWGIVGV